MKKFEEPKFEKTEFEAVAYLCTGSNEINNGGNSHSHSHSHNKHHNFPTPCPPEHGKPWF